MGSYMTVDQAATEWGINRQRVRVLLKAGRVPGAYRDMEDANGAWRIPADAEKPDALRSGPKPKV
jgi:hypothetical protein